jgi:cell wall-associated NlpC family hydrolase
VPPTSATDGANAGDQFATRGPDDEVTVTKRTIINRDEMTYTPRHAATRDNKILRRSMILAMTCGVGLAAVPAPSAEAQSVSVARRAIVTRYANAQVGDGYRFGASGPNYFDCSGLVMRAWSKVGVHLPHQSGQMVTARNIRQVPYSIRNRRQLQPGDLVFYYGSIYHPSTVSHVALFSHWAHGRRIVVAAVNTHYGVKAHWLRWGATPSGFGYMGH